MRCLLAVLAFLLLPVAHASGQSPATLDDAVQALRTQSVYNDPSAEARLSDAEVSALRSKIASSDAGAMYVAILPGSAGDPAQLAQELYSRLNRPGTYAVVAGHTLRAGSSELRVSDLADRAVAEHKDQGLPAILGAFVDEVGAARNGDSAGDPRNGSSSSGLIVLGALVLGGGAFALARGRRRRREQAAELEHVKDQVRDDLVELGEGLRSLDLDVDLASGAVREDYGRAVAAYDRANSAWTTARTVEDLEPVGAALEEGRWALEATRARLEGREPPERTAPCFFDPRHGPSSREVAWAPPGGAPRMVPACEADAQAVERGLDPGFREVEAGGQLVPYWAAGPAYSPFYGRGMFGGFGGLGLAGGLLGGLMLGDLLDGPDAAWGAPAGDWGGGGGDFGGGDFGGGDFGGGDF